MLPRDVLAAEKAARAARGEPKRAARRPVGGEPLAAVQIEGVEVDVCAAHGACVDAGPFDPGAMAPSISSRRARLGRDGGRVSRQDKNIGCSRTASSTHIGRILLNMTCGTMAASCTSTTCALATAMLARASWRRTRATPCVSTEAMSTGAGIQHSPAGCASRSVPTMSSTTLPRSAGSSRLEFKIRGSGRRSGARVVRTQERRRHGRTP